LDPECRRWKGEGEREMLMRGMEVVFRWSIEDLELENILERAVSDSESILPDELLLLWFDRGLLERRYWRAGRKGLGVSVFLAENIKDFYKNDFWQSSTKPSDHFLNGS
jgi:hypothetical protein